MTEDNRQVSGLSNAGFATVSRLIAIKKPIESDYYPPTDKTQTDQNLEASSNIHKEPF
ncbi:MAG: hypothetical protein ACI9NY_001926 [Kiritimatiellia bacterium]|jgi:hypothetical protein